MGVPPSGMGTPRPGIGYPPPPLMNRTTEGVLATRRAVCMALAFTQEDFLVLAVSLIFLIQGGEGFSHYNVERAFRNGATAQLLRCKTDYLLNCRSTL